ncbi:hypothetical protein EMCRGX_G024914 [Ephydatia muelleri]|eukprot:Em0015g1052a
MSANEAGLLDGYEDHFDGITVTQRHYGDISPEDFHKRLSLSLDTWKRNGRRGIWLRIPHDQAKLIPIATELGFSFHHTRDDYLMLTKWLPTDQPNKLPSFATHYVGVAGVVVNEKNEFLLVQEKWLRNRSIILWKFPGGMADLGENLSQTAIRETFEETGIKTEFVSVLMFRHMHDYHFGAGDLYFSCLLRPLNTDVTIDTTEIAAVKWMDVNEYIADPNTTAVNRMIAESYRDGMKSGYFIYPECTPHYLQNKAAQVVYRVKADGLGQPKANM